MRKYKILSVMLALMIVVTVIPMASISASATTKTTAQAISWLDSLIGKKVGSGQCVALIKSYYEYLGVSAVSGNGCDYATNSLPSGWQRIKGGTPKKGDILVWTNGYKGYGHVAICGGDNKYYHQNWSGLYVQVLNKSYTGGFSISQGAYYAKYWGVIRPNFSPAMQITYENITVGEYCIKNKYNQKYMNVAYGDDKDKTTIHTHQFGEWDSEVYHISTAKDGYLIRPLSSATRVVNPYANTVVSGKIVNLYHQTYESSQWWKFQPASGGYVIRNVQNPNVCITANKSNDSLTVETYTGDDNQIWILEKRVSLSFNANGGTGAPKKLLKRVGYSFNLPTSTPSRSGYDFLGWSTSKSSTKPSYYVGSAITLRGAEILYAVWQKKIYKIGNAKLSNTSYIYDGKVKTPAVIVKNTDGNILVKNKDYTVAYSSGRKNAGNYKVKITFKGKYSGSKYLNFRIYPKGTSVSQLNASKKYIKVSWKKQTMQTTGYQIQYSTSRKFASAKTKTVYSNKTVSTKIASLKSKKGYYVRIRTYKRVGLTNYYSSWSAYKYIKTK